MGNCSLRHREPGATDDTRAGKAEASLSRATSHCRQARRAEQGPGGGSQVQPESKLPEKFVVTRQGQARKPPCGLGSGPMGPLPGSTAAGLETGAPGLS